MKLSFVVPAYNEEKYITRCLDALAQAYVAHPDTIEIIVVNNASVDRTRDLAAGYPCVRVVDEPQKGLSRARHAGFLASTGDLIANVDADTALAPGWIETVLHEFEQNEQLVALSGPFIFYDASTAYNHVVRMFYFLVYGVYAVNRFVLNRASMLQGGNYVVRRSALEKINGYDLSYDFYGEDADVARRLHPHGAVKFTLRLPIYASNRRLAKEGAVMMALKYGANYFWTVFFKKPFTKQEETIR